MDKPKIEVFDIPRMFLGDLPWNFLFEVGFRTFLMFIFLLIMMRWSGKRSINQLSPFEFALIISLGSAVGDPMFYEDVPLLHGLAVIVVIVLLLRLLTAITQNNPLIERVFEGKTRCIVKDGKVIDDMLKKEKISSQELFSILRESGIRNLAEVERAYMEFSGKMSVFRFQDKHEKIGLCLFPVEEVEKIKAGTIVNGNYSCTCCGNTKEFKNAPLIKCDLCENNKWLESEKYNYE